MLDFKEYMRSCTDHLEAKTTTGENYYKQVNEKVLKEAQEKITNIVKEGFNNEILSKEEYSAMLPPDKAPPIRGIVSTSGTLLENIAIYLEHHIKVLEKSHPSYLEDTPDFLRHIP